MDGKNLKVFVILSGKVWKQWKQSESNKPAEAGTTKLPIFDCRTTIENLKSKIGDQESGHGRAFSKDGRIYLVTYHPAAAMRFPHVRRKMMQDIRKLSELLK